MKLQPDVKAGATFSPDEVYRYTLTRHWGPDVDHVLWIMLNPSTATAEQDDPTIRKCQTYARNWGYSGITVLNIFALRSTNPKVLYSHPDPIGPENDEVIAAVTGGDQGLTVCAWGNHGQFMDRGKHVYDLMRQHGVTPNALEVNGTGQPKHPLYVKGDVPPTIFFLR